MNCNLVKVEIKATKQIYCFFFLKMHPEAEVFLGHRSKGGKELVQLEFRGRRREGDKCKFIPRYYYYYSVSGFHPGTHGRLQDGDGTFKDCRITPLRSEIFGIKPLGRECIVW